MSEQFPFNRIVNASDVSYWRKSGKYLLGPSLTAFDPSRTSSDVLSAFQSAVLGNTTR
jgi:hypothetical protein